jgi:hypothetical protein
MSCKHQTDRPMHYNAYSFLASNIGGHSSLYALYLFRSMCEADHSPPSSAEDKNTWRHISIPQYAFMAWCSVEAREQIYLLPLHGLSAVARQTGRKETGQTEDFYIRDLFDSRCKIFSCTWACNMNEWMNEYGKNNKYTKLSVEQNVIHKINFCFKVWATVAQSL